MGLYDREYYRDDRPGTFLGGDRSMVTNLILVNVGVYLLDLLLDGQIREHCSLRADLFRHPWDAWQLLTAGFIHDRGIMHIVVNMLVFFFFGRDVEGTYGRMEFLRIYLSLIVLSSLAWVISQTLQDRPVGLMMGASGAVMGVLILYVLHFPKRLIYIYGVIPLPAWAAAVLYVGYDLLGFSGSRQAGDKNVAYEAHLAGALFAFLYFKSGINLGRLMPAGMKLPRLGSRPQLRVHDPSNDVAGSLDQRVDTILDKVAREGIESLSDAERKLLEDASRRYQRRRS
ncbi:MAG TPA: rhomboid family intramembrane serine protease [Pirellulales bacterium]|jgi:membrane associated rhomboid family serine protease